MIRVDDRRNYGEVRWRAFGPNNDRLHVLGYTIRNSNLRVISLRKANDREFDFYERAAEE